jgi:hypothetical protein
LFASRRSGASISINTESPTGVNTLTGSTTGEAGYVEE